MRLALGERLGEGVNLGWGRAAEGQAASCLAIFVSAQVTSGNRVLADVRAFTSNISGEATNPLGNILGEAMRTLVAGK